MKTTLNILLAALFLISLSLQAQDGEKLFKQNCGVCHTVGKGKLVGPDLKGSHEKFKEDWLLKWIKSSQSLVKAGDPTAVKLFEENNKMVMPDQPLADADIKSIIGFVKSQSEAPAEVAKAPDNGTQAVGTPEVKSEPYDYRKKEASAMSWKAATYFLIGFCIILVVVVIALANTLSGMAKTLNSPNPDGNQRIQ